MSSVRNHVGGEGEDRQSLVDWVHSYSLNPKPLNFQSLTPFAVWTWGKYMMIEHLDPLRWLKFRVLRSRALGFGVLGFGI